MSNISSCCDGEGNIIMSTFDVGFVPQYIGKQESVWIQWLLDLSGWLIKIILPQLSKDELVSIFNSSFHNGSVSSNVFQNIHSHFSSTLSFLLPIIVTCVFLVILVLLMIIFVYYCFSKKSKAADVSNCVFMTCIVLMVISLIICAIFFILILSSWNVALDEYPDGFLNHVDAVESDVKSLFKLFIESVEELNKEQFHFVMNLISTTLQNLPSLTFKPVDEEVDSRTSDPLESFEEAFTSAIDTWDEANVLFQEMINMSKLINSILREGSQFSGCDYSDPTCKSSTIAYKDLINHDYVWNRDSPLESTKPEVFSLSLQSDINAPIIQSKSSMVNTISDASQIAIFEVGNLTELASNNINDLYMNISTSLNSTIEEFNPNGYLWNSPNTIRDDENSKSFQRSFMKTLVLLITFSLIFILVLTVFMYLTYKPDVQIAERSLLSHIIALSGYVCAAISIFIGLYVGFIAIFAFMYSAPLSSTCTHLQESNHLMLDDPYRFDARISYVIANSVLKNEAINLTLKHIINSCRRGEKFYNSFLLRSSSEFSIEKILDLQFLLPNIDGILSGAAPDISGTKLLQDATITTLNDFQASTTDSNRTSLITTADDVKDWISQMKTGSPDFTQFCTSCETVPDIVAKVNGYIVGWDESEPLVIYQRKLELAVDNSIPQLTTMQNSLRTKKTELDDKLSALETNIQNQFLPAINETHEWISENASGILSENLNKLSSQIKGYMRNYIDWVKEMLSSNIAECTQIAILYDIIWESGCSKICNSVASISLLSWSIFCSYFTMIVALFILARGLYRDKKAPPRKIKEKSTRGSVHPIKSKKKNGFSSARVSPDQTIASDTTEDTVVSQHRSKGKKRIPSASTASESSVPEAERTNSYEDHWHSTPRPDDTSKKKKKHKEKSSEQKLKESRSPNSSVQRQNSKESLNMEEKSLLIEMKSEKNKKRHSNTSDEVTHGLERKKSRDSSFGISEEDSPRYDPSNRKKTGYHRSRPGENEKRKLPRQICELNSTCSESMNSRDDISLVSPPMGTLLTFTSGTTAETRRRMKLLPPLPPLIGVKRQESRLFVSENNEADTSILRRPPFGRTHTFRLSQKNLEHSSENHRKFGENPGFLDDSL